VENKKLSRPLRFACLFLSAATIFALTASLVEEPMPWKFQISGSVFMIVFGYLGITGKAPKWIK
jgi:hypothetical protein